MTPASIVISKFGGVRPTARKLGLNPSTVCRWAQAREDGGTGGLIPQKHFKQILSLLGKEISLEQLYYGAE